VGKYIENYIEFCEILMKENGEDCLINVYAVKESLEEMLEEISDN
jgi:hypothetical protein